MKEVRETKKLWNAIGVFIQLYNGTEHAPVVKHLLDMARGTEFRNMFRSIFLLLLKSF